MPPFPDYLRAYDVKERAWLVRTALGRDDPRMCQAFLDDVASTLGLTIPLRREATWWGVDYHLTWLWHVRRRFEDSAQLPPRSVDPVAAWHPDERTTVEDFDLVLADDCRLILIEAKAVGAWSTAQMTSKARFLSRFAPDGLLRSARAGPITVRFLMLSWREQRYLNRLEWPTWARDPAAQGRPFWMRMRGSPLVGPPAAASPREQC